MSTSTPEKMRSVVNTVSIDAPVERVWRCCTDVERWPTIFPGVLEVSRTEVGTDEVVMDMTVQNTLGHNSVRSHRRYRPGEHCIDFAMVSLPPAIASMAGDWVLSSDGASTRLAVRHDFVAQPGSDAGELSTGLYVTTDDVLGLLKEWLEADRDLLAYADTDRLRDAWGPRTASNGISPEIFETCELFFSRLVLAGLDWGDITLALRDLRKASTHADWADWHRRWSALGVHHEGRGAESLAAGLPETARVSYRKAAACHHYAEFFYFDDMAAKQASRDRVTAVFERVLPHLREVVRPLRVRHEGVDVPGYLMTPPGEGPWPTVVLVNGLDSAKEVELYAFAREFLTRGMAAVVFDGPGQGVHVGRTPMVVDFERVVAAVLAEITTRPEVDAERMGIFGVSFGGYLAARAAASVPGFRACVNLSGGFDHDGFASINAMVREDFRVVFGMPDDAAMEELARGALNLRDVSPLQVPLLAIHGELDSIIPMESCLRMLDWAAGETDLIRYPGERHVATNYFGDFIPRFCDWMGRHLGAVAR